MVRDPISEALSRLTDEDTEEQPPVGLPANQALDLLSARRRRAAIRVVAALDDDEMLNQKEFVKRVAAREEDTAPHLIGYKTYKSVYSSMKQTHLPKLNVVRAVSWTRPSNEVGPHDETEALAALLELIEAHCEPYDRDE